MTTRLYYDSAYLTEWETEIMETFVREDGIYVSLKETAFYPHGGGQPCDNGNIQGIAVLDVIQEEGQILHKLEYLPEGSQAMCRIDWDRRFDHMQQHSGQHLLSAICLQVCQAKTLSFHLGEEYCTIDVAATEWSASQQEQLEREVNRHIYMNHEILSYMVTEDEANQLDLVKETSLTDNIRIVEIKDVEYNACGGTHVSSTGAVGIIKLLKSEKQKGNIRIYFKCGNRALADYHELQGIIGALTVKFKTGKDEIIARIDKWEQDQKQLQTELTQAKALNDSYAARELIDQQEGKLITAVFHDKPFKDVQSLASLIVSQCDTPVLLLTTAENKVVLAQGKKSELACGALFKEHQGQYNGKGGGNDLQAQAAFTSEQDAHAFYEHVAELLHV